MKTHTIQTDLVLVTEVCCNCSIVFAMPTSLQKRCKERGEKQSFYCPNGHGQHYTVGEIQQLEERLARANSDRIYWMGRHSEAQDRLDGAERRVAAQKGQVTKLKKRISQGVCPCCNRSFVNLQRHMQGQHPEWQQTED